MTSVRSKSLRERPILTACVGKGEHKANEHVKLNPNGRIPSALSHQNRTGNDADEQTALVDHKNGDFVVWESNAIILYLVDKYDQGNKISAGEGAEKYQQLMWLFFQSSGQGPYFGQGAWFKLFHSEQLPSAQERYYKEILRVFGVLEDALQRNGSGWLVGNKRTIADISFIPWDNFATAVIVKDFNSTA